MKYIIANWKMHGSCAHIHALPLALKERVGYLPSEARSDREGPGNARGHLQSVERAVQLVMCVPFPYIPLMVEASRATPICCGAQNCAAHGEDGPWTGEVSARMLRELGCSYVLIGHSERRRDHHESAELVRKKLRAAHEAGLIALLCIGENEQAHRDASTASVLEAQLAGALPETTRPSNTIIAYEPLWAIGTGLTPSYERIAAVHGWIDGLLLRWAAHHQIAVENPFRILYGGSVIGENVVSIVMQPRVDGVLVGKASLSWPLLEQMVQQVQCAPELAAMRNA